VKLVCQSNNWLWRGSVYLVVRIILCIHNVFVKMPQRS
jgi:hypothetical protein